RMRLADQRHDQDEGGDDLRDIGHGRQALPPEMRRAFMSRAVMADAAKRGFHLAGHQSTASPMIQTRTVRMMDATSVAVAMMSRAGLPSPTPVSQMRCRMPPSMWWMMVQV